MKDWLRQNYPWSALRPGMPRHFWSSIKY